MITKIEIPFDSELQEQEIIFPKGFEASIEGGKIILRKVESEDEKIRKEMIMIFKGQIAFTSEEDAKKYIAWLEKQGEPKELSQTKVTKISDKDDDLDALEQAIFALEDLVDDSKPNTCYAGYHLPFKEAIKRLKSLKERISL